jgi:hypothetical protein
MPACSCSRCGAIEPPRAARAISVIYTVGSSSSSPQGNESLASDGCPQRPGGCALAIDCTSADAGCFFFEAVRQYFFCRSAAEAPRSRIPATLGCSPCDSHTSRVSFQPEAVLFYHQQTYSSSMSRASSRTRGQKSAQLAALLPIGAEAVSCYRLRDKSKNMKGNSH